MGPIAGFKVIFGFDDGEIKEFGEPELAEMVGNERLSSYSRATHVVGYTLTFVASTLRLHSQR